jgi:CPA2 family monovalent cation:H+ antiporter-2
MTEFLMQATIFLLAAVIAVPLAMRFGLGSVIGYLGAGILIGPVLGLVGHEVAELQHFAEFGIVMMLFLIGLELEPRALWDMRDRLLGLGGAQVGLTMAAVTSAMMMLDYTISISLAVGMVMALSSTAIVLQTLTEKNLMSTPGGRSSFSVLLTQDIAVIPMLAFLPLLALPAVSSISPDGSIQRPVADGTGTHGPELLHVLQNLPGWGLTLVTIAAIAAIILGGHYLTRPVFNFVNKAGLREMNTAVSLLFVVGVASLMLLVGLSPALGAFLAGVVLANSEFRHEIEADVAPFKGLLLGLFFITVGAGIDFNAFFAAPITMLSLALGLIAIKGTILFGLALVFKIKGRDRWLFTLSLTQAGEFGFVLVSFSVNTNVLPIGLSQTLLLVIALSMLFTPLLFITYERLAARINDAGETPDPDAVDEQQPIIIAGIGRFGQMVNRLVQVSGFKTTVLDHDLSTIELMRSFGFKGFYGDPTRPELLHAAGLKTAKILVVALDDRKAALHLVRHARRERADLHIIARANDRVHAYELYDAGANKIVREAFDSSVRAGRYVLEGMGLSDYEAANQAEAFWKHDRHALLELAELWKPGVPVAQNEAYMERARELNNAFETALVTVLDDGEPETDEARRVERTLSDLPRATPKPKPRT